LRLGVVYFAEPILVNAATQALLDNSLLEQTLYLLDDAMKKGMLDAGARGELVARFLLILAKDVLHINNEPSRSIEGRYCYPVTVRNYFISMMGEKTWNKMFADGSKTPLPSEVADGWISMSHFTAVEDEFNSPEKLLQFWCRGSAIIPKRNQRYVDLVVPILPTSFWNDGDKNKKMSYILIQIKNYKGSARDRHWPASATSMLRDWLFFTAHTEESLLKYPPYITLYMDIGKSNADIRHIPMSPAMNTRLRAEKRDRQHHVVIDGLGSTVYPFISKLGDNVEKAMKSLRESHLPWVEQINATTHLTKQYNVTSAMKILTATWTFLKEKELATSSSSKHSV
jgi:hypothetical protein